LVVDVAVPRDVDPAAADLTGVTLLDMDDLRSFAEAGQAERRREIDAVRSLVGIELDRYVAQSSAREVAPLVTSLHDRAEAVRQAELERFRARLGDLDDRQIDAVEALSRGIVAKLLHDPTVSLKDAAGTPKGERLSQALRDLFSL
jgi:glutamyl-tRNA reductase